MTKMDGKKDPGKFTVRFNVADPQQREVAYLLNQQGRFKAQFLTNAVQHYIRCNEVPDLRRVPPIDDGRIERIVRSILAEQQTPQAVDSERQPDSNSNGSLHGTDRDAIFRTLEAFQHQ